MRLTDRYLGGDDPFEGDRMLWLRSLPASARITKATITLTPPKSWADGGFPETFTFNTTVGPGELPATAWGVTKTAPGPFIEVDFHARRTLAQVIGSGGASTLQVDMGGAYVGVAGDGTFMAPGKTAWPVNLSSAPVALPGLTVNKFRLSQAPHNTQNLDVTKVTIRSVSTNVSVGLGQMPPFWTRLGELATSDTSPDFAPVLNAFLAEAQPQHGFYSIPFVVHSDTIARLDVMLAIDFVIEQPILPPHLPEVTLPYGFSTLPGADEALTTVVLPREANPIAGQSGAQIRGEFQPTRIALGPIGEEHTTFPVVVSPECALAQPLRSNKEIAVIGVDLPLANTQPGLAGLNVAIQADADGKPSGEVLASAEVRVEKPLPSQSAWGSATLPALFRILPGVRYWLVLQSQAGQAYWNATPGAANEPAMQCSRDGGLSWRMMPAPAVPAPLAALFRLRDEPERFSVPIQLQIGKGPEAVRRRLDEFAPLGRVEFRFDFVDKLKEHLSKPGLASPCGKGELLANGSFDQPSHDDATRRLFGFDAGTASAGVDLISMVDLSRGVDLSTERVIALSIAAEAPVRIDCAGANPARTTLDEVTAAINRVKPGVAFKHTITTGPSAISRLGLHGPVTLHPWRQATVPQGWQRPAETGAQIWRVKLPTVFQPGHGNGPELRQPERIVAALEASVVEPVFLAQRVPVAGGCTYILRFLHATFRPADAGLDVEKLRNVDPSSFTPPRWEVNWLDARSQVIQEEQGVLRPPGLDPPQIGEGFAEGEVRLAAPAGTAQAEIRFVQPPPGFLVLDDVSFAPTGEALVNGGLRLWGVGSDGMPILPLGWTHVRGWVDPDLDPKRRGLIVKLRGNGPEDAILSQTADVIAGETYELRVHARPIPPLLGDQESRPVQQRARLELHWLDDGPLEVPVTQPLDGRDFPTHAWKGAALVGATRAEVRLIQPQGRGDLLIESVSLERADLVPVPLIFLAEAPGELTVSNLRVAYDLPEPPGQPQPPTRATSRVQAMTPGPQPLTVVSPVAPVIAAPLTAIPGIGEARARRLAEVGIDSIEKLATAAPEEVARALRKVGVSAKYVARFVEEARRLLASGKEP